MSHFLFTEPGDFRRFRGKHCGSGFLGTIQAPTSVLKVTVQMIIKGSKCHTKTHLLSCSLCEGDRNTILPLSERESSQIKHLAEDGAWNKAKEVPVPWKAMINPLTHARAAMPVFRPRLCGHLSVLGASSVELPLVLAQSHSTRTS